MQDENPKETDTPKPNFHLNLAQQIKEGKAGGQYLYCMQDGKYYHYKEGCWQGIFEVDFIGRIQEHLPKLISLPLPMRKQVAENFKYISRTHLSTFNNSDLINLKNTMLCPVTGENKPHSSSYYSTNRLPYSYNGVYAHPLWTKTLDEIMEGDKSKINILQEFFGLCLTKEIKHHKALLLLGESRSGKSTILQVLRNMVGNNNCSSVPIKYISNPQYTPMLINKLVNIDTDVSAKAAEFEAEFKTITSGEPVSANQKYIEAFDFIPYCKIVMAANIFPRIKDHSSAFYNRLILIPCDRVFTPEEQNRDLPKQLLEELPGILHWSMEGLRRLNERGRFEELDFMREAVQELEDDNNPVNAFFNEHIQVSIGTTTYIEKGELYKLYENWSKKTNTFTLNSARFASCVFRRYHKQTPKTTTHPETKKRIWRNIKYIDDKEKEIAWQD